MALAPVPNPHHLTSHTFECLYPGPYNSVSAVSCTNLSYSRGWTFYVFRPGVGIFRPDWDTASKNRCLRGMLVVDPTNKLHILDLLVRAVLAIPNMSLSDAGNIAQSQIVTVAAYVASEF